MNTRARFFFVFFALPGKPLLLHSKSRELIEVVSAVVQMI